MNRRHLPPFLAGLALFGLGVAAGQIAKGPSDSRERTEIARADLSGAPDMEVIASTSEYKPGDGIPRHLHHGIEAFYVIQGATVQAKGEKPITLPTGASNLNLRDVAHGGWIVVGETSLKLFTVHVVDKGKPLYDSAR